MLRGLCKSGYDLLSSDVTLETLLYNDRQIDGFAPKLTDYSVLTQRGEFPHVVAKAFDDKAKIEVEYMLNDASERVFAFVVEAENKTNATTQVRMNTPKSSSTALKGIYFNGYI